MNNISSNKKCDYNDFKRARYFDGELMNKPIFDAEQLYHNEKRKLLNRMLHGWGVVCGLKIRQTDTKSSSIIIESGLALDCAGNEIFVCEPYTLNVAELVSSCTNSEKQSSSDECPDEEDKEENKWYVVIRYKEVPADPVPIYVPSGGCEEKGCEHSRVKEGYCLDLCRTVPCPEKLRKPGEKCDPCIDFSGKKEEIRELLCEKLLLPCTGACCDHPQVVLGSITLTSKTEIDNSMINNWECRKYVITFSLLQHWMTLLAPKKVPFEAIVDYTRLGDACKSIEAAQNAFAVICDQDTDESGETSDEKYDVMVGNRDPLYHTYDDSQEDDLQRVRVGDGREFGNTWRLDVDDVGNNKVKISLYKKDDQGILQEIHQEEVQKGDIFTYIGNEVPLFITYVENILRETGGGSEKFVHLRYTWAVNGEISYNEYDDMVGNRDPLDLTYVDSSDVQVDQQRQFGGTWRLKVDDVDNEDKVKISLYKNNREIQEIHQKEVQEGDIITYIGNKVPLFITYVEKVFRETGGEREKFVQLRYTWAVNE
jgi:hypothetical protein